MKDTKHLRFFSDEDGFNTYEPTKEAKKEIVEKLVSISTIKEKLRFLEKFRGLIILNLTLLSVSVVILLTHYILGTDYPIARFSLYLLPLFIIHLVVLLGALHEFYSPVFSKVILLFLGMGSVSLFLLNFDWRSYTEWEYDQNTKQAMVILDRYHKKKYPTENNVRLNVNWLFTPSTNFYRETLDIQWLAPIDRELEEGVKGYIYTFTEEFSKLEKQNFDTLAEFENTHTILVRVIP